MIIVLAAIAAFFYFKSRSMAQAADGTIAQKQTEWELRTTQEKQSLLIHTSTLESENKEYKNRISQFEIEQKKLSQELIQISQDKSRLETEIEQTRKHFKEQLAFVETAKEKLLENFKSLSLDSLNQNSTSFIQLAKSNFDHMTEVNLKELDHRRSEIKETVNPIFETLNKFETKISELEKNRIESFAQLFSHFGHLKEAQDKLRSETSNLVKALRTPQVRGRWGELQLKRVVEIAGMLEFCDFYQQESVDTDEGKLRPDMVVRLPGNKTIVVDSKAVLHAYLEAAQCEDENLKKELMLQHAGHIRSRIQELSKKSYWEQFESSPEFVVLFLPGESFFASALEVSPILIEEGVTEKVILATPTTLIALLKAVSYGWKQASLTDNARQISQLGKELYKRLMDMSGHFQKLGSQLGSSVESYNKTLASFESRVLVSARKFKELKSIDGNEEIELGEPIEKLPRIITLDVPKE